MSWSGKLIVIQGEPLCVRFVLQLPLPCSQGRYSEALDQWEQAKKNGVATPQLYSSVMQLAAQAGGTEAAQYVKEDMDKQGWNMDHRYWIMDLNMYYLHITHYNVTVHFSCSLHYLGCLASEGQISDVVRFIKSSHLKVIPSGALCPNHYVVGSVLALE